jgi:choline-sulfatase
MNPRTAARLVVFAALLLSGVGCSRKTEAPKPTPGPRPVNIVFILLDAVRADHLTPYGYTRRDTTPFLASLAEKSVVFDRAYAVSTWTPSSMASIFTSLYVNQHGVLTGYRATKTALERGENIELNRIPSTVETLPEVMKRLGYRTFGVADNLNICERMGFSRGFDQFSPHNKEGSDVVNKQIRDWRGAIRSAGKYFLYIHYMDAHVPYRPRAPWYDEKVKPAEASAAAYDSNLSLIDERVRKVFEILDFSKDTLVVVTADHGEEFQDHGGAGHKNKLYNELLRVPLIVYFPERLSPRRVADPVSNIDLLPTFRELAGDKPSRFDQGISFFKTLAGPPTGEPRTFFPMRWSEVAEKSRGVKKGVLREKWKYIVTLPEKKEELYDTEADPRERANLASKNAAVVAEMRTRLEEFEKNAKVFKREFAAPAHISPEQAEQLKALGYVQ